MELEESTYLTSGSITKPQSSRQYGTGNLMAAVTIYSDFGAQKNKV